MTSIWDEALDAQPEPEPTEEIEQAFAPKVATDAFSLLHLGRISERLELFGHTFDLRTLTIGEELRVAALVRQYAEVPGAQGRSFILAMVAAALQMVDGRLFGGMALGPKDDPLPRKYDEASQWPWRVVEKLYERYLDMELRQQAVLDDLEKKSETSRQRSDSSSDS